MNLSNILRRYFPILTWGAEYSRRTLTNDLIVAAIVTIMLIPQSLAYALLAGLPAQVGLYASMAPLRAVCDLRHFAHARGRPRSGGQPHDRGCGGTDRVPGNPGVSRRSHRARRCISGLLLLAMGLLRLGIPRELPQSPGHLGLHHRLGHPDRGWSARASARHQGRGRESAWTC